GADLQHGRRGLARDLRLAGIPAIDRAGARPRHSGAGLLGHPPRGSADLHRRLCKGHARFQLVAEDFARGRNRPARRVGRRQSFVIRLTSMRVLLSLTYYRPYVSGLTIYVERLGRALAERGHYVTVLTSQYEGSLPREELLDGVHVVRVPVAARISKGV